MSFRRQALGSALDPQRKWKALLQTAADDELEAESDRGIDWNKARPAFPFGVAEPVLRRWRAQRRETFKLLKEGIWSGVAHYTAFASQSFNAGAGNDGGCLTSVFPEYDNPDVRVIGCEVAVQVGDAKGMDDTGNEGLFYMYRSTVLVGPNEAFNPFYPMVWSFIPFFGGHTDIVSAGQVTPMINPPFNDAYGLPGSVNAPAVWDDQRHETTLEEIDKRSSTYMVAKRTLITQTYIPICVDYAASSKMAPSVGVMLNWLPVDIDDDPLFYVHYRWDFVHRQPFSLLPGWLGLYHSSI